MKKVLAIIVVILLAATFTARSSSAITFWSETSSTDLLWLVFQDIELNGPTPSNLKKLDRLIEKYPDSESADEAILKSAQLHTAQKNFNKAAERYGLLVKDYPRSKLIGQAFYGLGYSLYRSGNINDARRTLKSAISRPEISLNYKVKSELLIDTITALSTSLDRDDNSVSIGAVLPLKGAFAAFGEDALRGIMLATHVFGSENGREVELRVEDSGGSDKTASNAVRRLDRDKKVMGMIGPLLSTTAQAAATTAQRTHLPTIVLSQKQGIPNTGDYVFRNFMTAARQARVIAEHAVTIMEHEKIGILYPDNTYGENLARNFKKAVLAAGGSVPRLQSYPPGKKDFGQELKKFFGIEVEKKRIGRRFEAKYTITAKMDALYIPDNYATVAQIAPYLAYYNIKDVQLLGSNEWNSARLTKLAGRNVNGAVFVDGFHQTSERDKTAGFVRNFTEAYGYTPGILEAEAYDSTLILLQAITGDSPSRQLVKKNLKETKDFEGATGRISFNPSGEAVKELFLLRVEKDKIVEIK